MLEEMLEHAKSLFCQNEFRECIRICKIILESNSENIEVLILLSCAYLPAHEFDDALIYAERAYEIKKSADTHRNLYARTQFLFSELLLSNLSFSECKFKKCIKACKSMLEFNKKDINVLFLLCSSYILENQFDDALTYANIAHEIEEPAQKASSDFCSREESDSMAANWKGLENIAHRWFMEKKFQNCIKTCEIMHKFNSKNTEILLLLSAAYLHVNKFDNALMYANTAHEIKKSVKSYSSLYSAYSELGKTEEALFAVEEALKIEPENYLHHLGKFSCLTSLVRFEEAELVAKKTKELFDKKYPTQSDCPPWELEGFSDYYKALGLMCLEQKKYEDGLKNINNGLKLNSKDPVLWLTKGILSLHQRKTFEAIKCFESAEENGPSHFPPNVYGDTGVNFLYNAYRGVGFAYLYNDQFTLAANIFKKVYEQDNNDFITAIGLYDAYLSNNETAKADALVKNCPIEYFSGGTTKSAMLFEPVRPASYVIVYIWDPKQDPINQDPDYGHVAIKVVRDRKCFYFSWFPSGDNYSNKEGIPRSTPASYGKKKKIDSEEKATIRLQNLFENFPSNKDAQIKQMLMRKSDKEELRKNATFKFFFTKGIDIDRLLGWWKALLQSEKYYNEKSYNCCDVVLHSLQFALSKEVPEITSIKTSRMREHRGYEESSILKAHRYEISPQSGTKSMTVYKYCYLLANAINTKFNKTIPAVTVRYNRWNKKLRKLTKFDFNPLRFDPYWMTSTKKTGRDKIYSNLINHSFSRVLFLNIGNIDDKQNNDTLKGFVVTKSGDAHNDLVSYIKKIFISCQNPKIMETYLRLVDKRKYGSALRTACNSCAPRDEVIFNVIKALIRFKDKLSININEKNSEHKAPIDYAASKGNEAVYDLLVSEGADIAGNTESILKKTLETLTNKDTNTLTQSLKTLQITR